MKTSSPPTTFPQGVVYVIGGSSLTRDDVFKRPSVVVVSPEPGLGKVERLNENPGTFGEGGFLLGGMKHLQSPRAGHWC